MVKSPLTVIDAHMHCGGIARSIPQSCVDYWRQVAGTDIGGVALFAPVLEIYDRYDALFIDTPEWRLRRRESNAYALSLQQACGKGRTCGSTRPWLAGKTSAKTSGAAHQYAAADAPVKS